MIQVTHGPDGLRIQSTATDLTDDVAGFRVDAPPDRPAFVILTLKPEAARVSLNAADAAPTGPAPLAMMRAPGDLGRNDAAVLADGLDRVDLEQLTGAIIAAGMTDPGEAAIAEIRRQLRL